MIILGLLSFFLGFIFGLLFPRTQPKKDEWVPVLSKNAKPKSKKQATIVDLQDPIEKVQL